MVWQPRSAYDPNGRYNDDSLAGGAGGRISRPTERSRAPDRPTLYSLRLSVGVVTRASITRGGWGLGTRSRLGMQAISRGRPHTMLNLDGVILTDALGVMLRMNRLGRDISLENDCVTVCVI